MNEHIEFEIQFWTDRLEQEIENVQRMLNRALLDIDKGRNASSLSLGNLASRAGDINGMADRIEMLRDLQKRGEA
jgi:hypothetical protein